MTRSEFIAAVTEEIEDAVMRAQGIGDGFMSDLEPEERADKLVGLLPSVAFSD